MSNQGAPYGRLKYLWDDQKIFHSPDFCFFKGMYVADVKYAESLLNREEKEFYLFFKNLEVTDEMELSKHALVRKQQRGFQADDIEIITFFGNCVARHGNVVEYQMTRKIKKYLIQALDRIEDKAVLLSHNETTVVTLYNLDKKRRKEDRYAR